MGTAAPTVVERKAIALRLPDDAPPGSFTAIFSTFNVLDKGRDIVRRSAFADLDGQEVPLVWSHEWQTLPLGKGTIRVQPKQAVVEGRFHLQTQTSRDAYETVKAMGDLQEYSYGFEIAPDGFAFSAGEDGEPVREITKIARVYEVSPVLVGMGEDTRTVAIKTAAALPHDAESVDEKPFPNEHACRLRDPGDFQDGSFRRTSRESDGKTYDVIMGRLKGESTMTQQAFRYPKDEWSAAQARAHCSSHDGRSFEPAGESSGLCAGCADAKVGRRISHASEARIRAAIEALTALLDEATAADTAEGDDAKAASTPSAGAGDAAISTPAPPAADAPLDAAAAALEAELRAYVHRAEGAAHADVRAAQDAIASLSYRLAEAKRVLDVRRREARRGDEPEPSVLFQAVESRERALNLMFGRNR